MIADLVVVGIFVVIGRSSHSEGVTFSGVVSTAWPFVVGLVVGWVVARGWKAPTVVAPTGVVIWLVCVAAGMVLRVIAHQGVAAAFVVVALAFVGLGLLGWRVLLRWWTGRHPVPA